MADLLADPWLLVAFALLAVGVVGSALPAVPGPALSVAGVLLHWWSTGYTRPTPPVLALLAGVGVLALAVDLLAGFVAAEAGGASTLTSVVAGATGVVLLFLVGPLGVVVGILAVVFLVEYRRHGDARRGARTAAVTAIGLLASVVAQVLLTAGVLVGWVVAVVL